MIVEKIDTYGGHLSGIYALAPGDVPDAFFSAGGDGQIVRWHLATPDQGERIAQLPSTIFSLNRHPDSGLLWIGQNHEGLQLIDPAKRQPVQSLRLTSAAIFAIEFWQDLAIIGLSDGVLVIVETQTLTVKRHVKASGQSARCVAIHPTEPMVAVGYSDHTIRLFALPTFQLLQTLTGHTQSVFTVAFSPDGRRLVSGSRDAHLHVWDAAHGYTLQQRLPAHLFAVNHVVFSPNGQLLASASMDKSIKIWDADTLKLLKVVDKARHAGHGTSVNRLLWQTSTGLLLSAGDDRTIAVWKLHES